MTKLPLIQTIAAGLLLLLSSCEHKSVTSANPAKYGCMDVAALNYDGTATQSDSTLCRYAVDSVVGRYLVNDTAYGMTSWGADTFYSQHMVTVTRINANTIHFDSVIICNDCNPSGNIYYDAPYRYFSYHGSSNFEYGSMGNGSFVGDTLYYFAGSFNEYSFFCPYSKGRGIKQH